MYIFSTTTLKPLSTTKRWNGRDPGDYYFYHGGPDEDWDTRVDYFFGDETELKTRSTSENIEHGVSYLGLFLNFIHFFDLTRKELRSNVVFIIMIGICFSDILVFSSSFLERYFGKSDEIGYSEGWCGTRKQWWMILMELITQAIQKCGKLSSAILVFFMACTRSFSVLFPMSSMVNTMMKVRTGVIIVLVTMVACAGWYYEYYSEYHIQKPQKFKEACYTAFMTNYGRIHMTLEGSDSTSLLVVMMAVLFFVSEVIYCIYFIISDYDNDLDATLR
ncbi:unnamed protein product [Caenorhabditis brenneri]